METLKKTCVKARNGTLLTKWPFILRSGFVLNSQFQSKSEVKKTTPHLHPSVENSQTS